jgi:hypothetical protein
LHACAALARQPADARRRRERRLCFGELVEDGEAPEGLRWAAVNLSVSVRNASDAADERAFRPACGDALRIRFTSHRALFAPGRHALACACRVPRTTSSGADARTCPLARALPTRSQREAACGVHALRFIVPPDAAAYAAEVWVVHINGEGMADPPTPRLFPINLMTKQDGPLLYNIRARNFTGRRAAGRARAVRCYAGADAAWAFCDAGCARQRRMCAATRTRRATRTTCTPPRAPRRAWRQARAHACTRLRCKPRSDADAPTHAALPGAPLPRARHEGLPVCAVGDAPGRWVATHSLYSATPSEPLSWRPYGCRWRAVSGPALQRCLSAIGRVKFVGESTLGQVYENFQQHANSSGLAWPLRSPVNEARVAFEHPLLRAQGAHSEFHGLPTMLDKAGASHEIRSWRPRSVVHLQAANDAARDTLANYRQRLARYSAQLAALQAGEAVPESEAAPAAALRARLVWITAPVRHYKAGNGPGSASCPEGTRESCRAADAGTSFRHVGGDVAWTTHAAAPPLFYGTLDRRRAFNAHAVAHMRSVFPDIAVVDFEALTEALPSDYNMDGEHWGCNWEKWQNRHREPFQCRGLAHVTVSNILANVLCSDQLDAAAAAR